jgi:hypothetical protein
MLAQIYSGLVDAGGPVGGDLRAERSRARSRRQFVLITRFSDVDIAMESAGPFFGADNTTCEVTSGRNFCTGPQNRVFQNRFRADSTISPDNCAAAQLRAWIDNRGLVDRFSPVGVIHWAGNGNRHRAQRTAGILPADKNYPPNTPKDTKSSEPNRVVRGICRRVGPPLARLRRGKQRRSYN